MWLQNSWWAMGALGVDILAGGKMSFEGRETPYPSSSTFVVDLPARYYSIGGQCT